MKIEKIEINKLVPYEKNIKRHSDMQIKKIAESIKDVGFIQPIVVDENYVILVGHGRFEALKSLGEKEADCVVLKGLSETQKKSLRIRDNKLNESSYDISNLKEELQDLFDNDIDLQELGFSIQELESFDLEVNQNEINNILNNEYNEHEEFKNNEYNEHEEFKNNEYNEHEEFKNNEYNEHEEGFNYSVIKGKEIEEKKPIMFYLTNSEYEKFGKYYKTTKKFEYNVKLLEEVTEFYLKNNKNEQ